MTYTIKQSTTESALLFFLVESADHITGLTGASPTVTLSKNGGAFGSPSGTVSEIANGWYKVAGNATDTNTLGPLALHATAASGDPCDILVANIVAYDPQVGTNLGLSALPTANPGAANGVLIAGTNASTTIDGLTLAGTAAVTSTPATPGLTITGGAASTTAGGTAAPAISATGGAGAASTNGAAAGITSSGGGTTTVSGADGLTLTGTGNNNGLKNIGAGSGAGIMCNGGATGNGIETHGGATSGDGLLAQANAGNSNGITATHHGSGLDFNAQTTNALQVNATAINAVSTSSVTTVSAILGTTIAITFDGNNLPIADVGDWLGHAVTVDANNAPNVSAKYLGGTLLTARDIGASVLLSSGAGAGQILLSSGEVTVGTNADKTGYGISAAAVSSIWQDTTAGDFTVAASIGKSIMNGVALGTGLTINAYTGDTPQTGDCFARLGAPAGASVSADIAEIEGETDSILANTDVATSTRATPAQILTTALTESYAALHGVPTLTQAIFEIRSMLCEKSVSSTTLTTNKIDGATQAETFTLNSTTAPTAITRAS